MKLLSFCSFVLIIAGCTASYTTANKPAELGPNSIATSGILLSKLGERQASCSQAQDQTVMVIPEEYREQVMDLILEDKLKSFTFKTNQPCLRVGTEVPLIFSQGEKNFAGLAFVTSILVDSENTTVFFDNNLRVFTTHITEIDKRLPSCGSQGDWRSIRIGEENILEKMEKLKNGSFKAMILNGAVNCYRTGARTYVQTSSGDKEKRGTIVPQELYTIHLSELTQAHADLVNKPLTDLIKELEVNKDRDGGFVNIVVFDYTPPEKVE